MRTDDELRAEVGRLWWWHTMELRPGIVTPGRQPVADLLPLFGIPERLDGMSVLDVGAWDGALSFECERRGAKRVVACDVWQTSGRAAFDLARDELGSEVEARQCNVYDLNMNGDLGQFDLVLFLGVLYHLKHPLLALERVAAATRPRGLAIVDTVVDLTGMPRPAVAYYPGDEINGDPTTWCAPNHPALRWMLRDAGFDEIANPVPLYADNRSVFHALKASNQELETRRLRQDRETRKFHGPRALDIG